MNLIHGNNAVRRQNRLGQIGIAVGAALLAMLFFVSKGHAQEKCPENLVCISRDAALKALQDSDTVKAQAAELKDLKEKVIPALKEDNANLRVEFARNSGELTACKTNAVRDAVLIDLFAKGQKPKQVGLINIKLF